MQPSVSHDHRPILLLLTCDERRPAWVWHDDVQGAFDFLSALDLAEADRLASSCHPDLLLADALILRPNPGVATSPLCRLPVVWLGSTLVDISPGPPIADVLPLDLNGVDAAIRLRTVLRRRRPTSLTHRVRYAGFEIDHRERRTRIHGREVALSLAEFNLLALLLEAPGRIWSYAEIGRSAWDWGQGREDPAVRRMIQVLRAKLGDADGALVETVRGKGFRLTMDPVAAPNDAVA